jgi:hypothetical protein
MPHAKAFLLKMLFFLEVGESALLVCGRRVSGGCTPLRGTIVNNVDTARSKQAFRSRVSTKDCEYLNTVPSLLDHMQPPKYQ